MAGIEDEPTFTRSIIVNNQEEMQLVIQGAQFLTPEYVIEKILNLLGDGDRAKDMIDELHANELEASKIAVEEEEEEEVIE